jgi:hypothetical protein
MHAPCVCSALSQRLPDYRAGQSHALRGVTARWWPSTRPRPVGLETDTAPESVSQFDDIVKVRCFPCWLTLFGALGKNSFGEWAKVVDCGDVPLTYLVCDISKGMWVRKLLIC